MDLFARIDRLEQLFATREPSVLAFVPEEGRFERLRREAEALEKHYPEAEHRPDPGLRPPLFGVFLGVKDIFHVEGFPTRAGSQLPSEVLTGMESDAVTRLKHAGALIVGKTVTTEFAYFAPGTTKNPHNPSHTPGGSSSGSAAGVAAGLCEIALGTQTIGSVNRPAAFCGVVGYKPSYDRISRAGVIPLSPSVDHVGLFGTNVEPVERAARVVVRDWREGSENGDSTQPVLGIPDGPYLNHAEPEGLEHFRTMIEILVARFTVKSVPAMPDFEDITQRHNTIVAYEAARVHEKWFAEFGHLYHPKTTELIERGKTTPSTQYQNSLEGRAKLRRELTSLMETQGVDLWLSPSATGPAPRGLDYTGNPVMNLPWTHAGLPTLTLPAGTNKGDLPLGLQLTAGWYADEKLLSWAIALEYSI